MSKEQKADYFYNVAEWDCTHHDLDTLLDSVEPERYQVVKVGRLVEIDPVFVVRLPNPDDEDCDTDREFATVEEAEAAIVAAKATATESGAA